MSPQPILIGFVVFVLEFMTHLFLWRASKVVREMFTLFLIFLLEGRFILAIFTVVTNRGYLEFCTSLLVCLAFALVYLQTYPALKTEIPTFRLLFLIDGAKAQGISEAELFQKMKQTASLNETKLLELENDRLIRKEEGHLVLSPSGKRLSGAFILYRRLLGLEPGLG